MNKLHPFFVRKDELPPIQIFFIPFFLFLQVTVGRRAETVGQLTIRVIGFCKHTDKLEFGGPAAQTSLPLPLGEVPPKGAERALSVTA